MKTLTSITLASIFFSSHLFAADSFPNNTSRIQGEVIVYVADDFEHNTSETMYALRVNDKEYWIDSTANEQMKKRESGDIIELDADFRTDNTITPHHIHLLSSAKQKSSDSLMTGERRAVILALRVVDKAGDTSFPVNLTQLGKLKNSIETFMYGASFQNITMPSDVNKDGAPDVYGPFEYVQSDDACATFNWANAAKEAAESQGVDLSKYQHFAIAIYGKKVSCSWGGLAGVGCAVSCNSWWKRKNRACFFSRTRS